MSFIRRQQAVWFTKDADGNSVQHEAGRAVAFVRVGKRLGGCMTIGRQENPMLILAGDSFKIACKWLYMG
jgi:hypothetical protein